jgi:thiamine-phosphate pyrophosphorylase
MNHHENLAAHRLLDANLNRAFEALRTLEDIARFQDQAVFQAKYKILRHQLRDATQGWSHEQLYASRDANQDVGRETKTTSEASRTGGLPEIAEAASQRIQQSLRCLEETSKFVYPNSAAAIESVRYQVYDINAQLLLSQKRDLVFLKQSKLYVLADCQLSLTQFIQRIQEISVAGVDLIQIRDKQLDAQELIRFTHAAIEAVDPKQTRIIVNDRADIVQCTSAFGLHIGQTDLSIAQSRSLIAPSRVVGLSTHDLDQVKQAIAVGADYIGCGPTFASNTKDFSSFAGLPFLREAAAFLQASDSTSPAFAIGGINLANLESAIETGVGRVAVSKAIWGADRPGAAAEAFRRLLENSDNNRIC